ncbi:MAG: hypothetical protein DMD96_25260, partial [Candidatus Rokuibacteriota bacterium]
MLKTMMCAIEGAAAGDGVQSVTITTADTDRDGDRVLSDGLDVTNYLRPGGAVLFGHDYKSIPVGETHTLSAVPGRGIRATFTWLEGDAFADRVKNAWAQGVLSYAMNASLLHGAKMSADSRSSWHDGAVRERASFASRLSACWSSDEPRDHARRPRAAEDVEVVRNHAE